MEELVAPLADGRYVVVAGPGTSLTIPGIIVSEIASALSSTSPVRRIEVDLGAHPTMGLHRALSLAAIHDEALHHGCRHYRAPLKAKARKKVLLEWIGSDARMAIAYAWPGINNEWIPDFLQVAKSVGVATVVLCASLPASREARAVSLVSTIRVADRVVVGDADEARELVAAFGATGPEVLTHRALSLTGRQRRRGRQQLTAFLPNESGEDLIALMTAFDAIPDAQVDNYRLQIVMRYKGSAMKSIVDSSYHARHADLVGSGMTADDLRQLCDNSSALSMVDPQPDSRAFSAAVKSGIATVVLANSKSPIVGRGYVGGLMADGRKPASIHVALAHALRLDELSFPSPDAWRELAERVIQSPELTSIQSRLRLRPARIKSFETVLDSVQ